MKNCLLIVVCFGLIVMSQAGCGREASVVQPADAEPVDLTAQAAEEHPEEYANMANSQ
ncbi:hypothetical protein [Neorhodopirellula pilleata]|uniref:Secreted protein n=1 Tax=Neorhodopirellula pilleata TaxID=2714738 RepID=A0A5C5ZLL1_9BACT|nr:hypothetical protein [Neorhodopirellula pilleata]TWT87966.1 hypothetical protein Pla100_58180 [Neorhodopirellula pilleata]